MFVLSLIYFYLNKHTHFPKLKFPNILTQFDIVKVGIEIEPEV